MKQSQQPTSLSPSTSLSSLANSIQIRTSSPISTSSSSELSGPANCVISPSKFINAVHTSRKQQQQVQKSLHNYRID